MQFQADILSTEVIRPEVTETTALGAAYFAGLAVGFWKDVDELKNNWKEEKTFIPGKNVKREELIEHWKLAVNRSSNWIKK